MGVKSTKMKAITLFLTLVLSFAFVSCDKCDNFGYPHKCEFEKEGGTITITGDRSVYHLGIFDKDGNEYTSGIFPDESLYANYQWLSIRSKLGGTEIEIHVEPNETGKKRKLRFEACIDNRWAEIDVIQYP